CLLRDLLALRRVAHDLQHDPVQHRSQVVVQLTEGRFVAAADAMQEDAERNVANIGLVAELARASERPHATRSSPERERIGRDVERIHSAAMPQSLPKRARVVVIGGGVIGCSVAYHLADMGCTDVVLLERDKLTSGTTWHAAGMMVTVGSMSETSTEMRKYTCDLYDRLEAETGQSTGFS